MTAAELPDEWGPWLDNALLDPEFASAYRAAQVELADIEVVVHPVTEGASDG